MGLGKVFVGDSENLGKAFVGDSEDLGKASKRLWEGFKKALFKNAANLARLYE